MQAQRMGLEKGKKSRLARHIQKDLSTTGRAQVSLCKWTEAFGFDQCGIVRNPEGAVNEDGMTGAPCQERQALALTWQMMLTFPFQVSLILKFYKHEIVSQPLLISVNS